MDAEEAARDFEPHRKFLGGLAYRMLGSVAEADDVVQDAFLRWREVDWCKGALRAIWDQARGRREPA